MKHFCKKIVFSVIIGIWVLSLSLFALVGCGGNKAIVTPNFGENTMNDKDNNAQAGDASATTGDNQSTDNPSTDNPHATYGDGGTISTQPDSNNDDNNNNGGNSGENGGGQEYPNNNTGENGENHGDNTGDNQGENGGDNGNGGENGGDTPENPNPDDPTPDDPQPEELDFSGLEEKLEECVNEKSMYKVSSVENLQISKDEENIYVIADTNYKKNNKIFVYKIIINSEISKQASLDNFVENLSENNLGEVISFLKAKEDITIDDVTYSKDGI